MLYFCETCIDEHTDTLVSNPTVVVSLKMMFVFLHQTRDFLPKTVLPRGVEIHGFDQTSYFF